LASAFTNQRRSPRLCVVGGSLLHHRQSTRGTVRSMSVETSLFDSLLEPCFVIDREAKILYCNETAALLCGVSVRKAQRTTLKDLITTSEPLEWMDRL